MSVSQFTRNALLWGSLGCASLVLAADEVQPDLEFLEYLGSWEESDEDWILFAEEADKKMAEDGSKKSDSAPKGEASTESKDES